MPRISSTPVICVILLDHVISLRICQLDLWYRIFDNTLISVPSMYFFLHIIGFRFFSLIDARMLYCSIQLGWHEWGLCQRRNYDIESIANSTNSWTVKDKK